MEQQRNLIIAVVLSIAILFGFQYFLAPKLAPPPHHPASEAAVNLGKPAKVPVLPQAVSPPSPAARSAALAKSPRLRISTPRLVGSVDLAGARLDDLTLTNYHETWHQDSPLVQLLSPDGTANPYFAGFGWVAAPDSGIKTPDQSTVWHTDDTTIGVDHPATLTWDNGQGLRFVRKIGVDANYMFTVTQTVENHGAKSVTLYPYGLISRGGTMPVQSTRYLHVGPVGVEDGTLHELSYSDIKSGQPTEYKTTGGWFGLTDEYWLVSLIPHQSEPVSVRFSDVAGAHGRLYQVDYTGAAHSVAPGASVSTSDLIFAGAKEVHLLDDYETQLHIPRFDRAIDFGWFYFLTKPIFMILDWIYQHVGNFGLAIMLFTLGVKIIFFPLANKSYRSMSKMKLLQPQMKELKERFGDDKTRLNQEMMALYKRSGANPAAGCLPMVIQIPVFWSLYKVLYVTIEMRHAPFFGWIHDLSAPDPTSLLNLFGLLPWAPPEHLPLIGFLSIGAWPLIMGFTMFMQQKITPTSPDPTQAKMMLALPVVFTFMLAHFSAGLVIYWAWNNTLSVAQQWLILRQVKLKQPVKAQT